MNTKQLLGFIFVYNKGTRISLKCGEMYLGKNTSNILKMFPQISPPFLYIKADLYYAGSVDEL